MMLGWLIALYSIPEGIAAPYAARLSGGPVAAGLVIASGQVGAVLVTPIFTKSIGPLTRLRWMGPMAVCTCAVLPLTVFRPGLAANGDLRAVGHVRDLPNRREHRVCPELSKVKAFTEDNGFRDDFRKAKRNAKRQFCDWLRWSTGQTVDPESIFDCQVKRIHEYKRQLLNPLGS